MIVHFMKFVTNLYNALSIVSVLSYKHAATPVLDFIPVAERVVFTDGQSRGDSVCTDITIIPDFFVESEEVFEVTLLPNPEDILAAIIQAGKDRALVTISDGQNDRSMILLCLHPYMY